MAVETRTVRGLYQSLRALELWLDNCMHEERDEIVRGHYRTVSSKVADVRERVLELLMLLEEETIPKDM